MSDFSNNTDKSRFELEESGHTAIANYRLKDDTIYIDFVEAPPALRGTGAAGKLMGEIVGYAEQKGYDIVPICGYAAHWMDKNRKS